MIKALVSGVVVMAFLGLAAVWYYQPDRVMRAIGASPSAAQAPDAAWLEHLYSQNTLDAAEAVRHVEMLGEKAVPIIQRTLGNPAADATHRKAALKAAGILGPVAAPAVPLVAAELAKPDFTAEAALALSFMGRDAFPPLRDALTSGDEVVRREALRSVGKLKERAPLETSAVLPLLLDGMRDPDPGVRVVAATYLGIIHEWAAEAVPVLIAALDDANADVRRAGAEALGSFGTDGAVALPALRKASTDKDPDVAREAALAIVKLQSPT